MRTTYKQDAEFIEAVIPANLLEQVAEYIAAKFSPEDVFSTSDLETWAEENGWEKQQ